jgi:uncharacterized RDD family membrane protein YckC
LSLPSPTPSTGKETEIGKGIAPGDLPVARLGDRLIALVLDSIVGAVAFALIGMFAAVRLGGLTQSGFSLEGRPALMGMAGALIVGFLYYWLAEGLFGATLGKAIVGLRVRDKSGAACGLKASFIRNLLRILDGLAVYLVGFLVAVLSRMRQRLGDHLAGTVVVERPSGTPMRALVILLWLILVAGGGWLAYRMHADASASAGTGWGKRAVGKAPPTLTGGPPQRETESQPRGRAEGELAVVNFAFLQEKEGSVRPTGPYRPGEKVHARFEVVGFKTDEGGRAHLRLDVVPLDPGGLKLYQNWKAEFEEPLKDARGAVPTSFSFDLPQYAPAGSYTLAIRVRDELKERESTLSPVFTVEAPRWRPASQLEIRDFRFSRSEGGAPEPHMVLEGGGKVYMAFQVAGMQFREDGVDVGVAMRVLGPGGDIMLEKADLVEIRDAFFYHPPTFFKEITSWVTLPPDAPRGAYVASFEVTDRFADKTVRHDGRFEVR